RPGDGQLPGSLSPSPGRSFHRPEPAELLPARSGVFLRHILQYVARSAVPGWLAAPQWPHRAPAAPAPSVLVFASHVGSSAHSLRNVYLIRSPSHVGAL